MLKIQQSLQKNAKLQLHHVQSCFDIEHHRQFSGNKCSYNPGYFQINIKICSKCSNECATFQGQADYCTYCDINSISIDQSPSHKRSWITGFYQDQNKICQKCHIKCYLYINQSYQCLSCNLIQNSNRKSLSGQCNCKDGYFDDGISII